MIVPLPRDHGNEEELRSDLQRVSSAALELLPTATGPPSRRRRTQMLKPLGWPRRPAPPRAPLQPRPDPSLTAPESEARALCAEILSF